MQELEIGNKRLKIIQDITPESPRGWDNLGRMIFFGGQCNLGDYHEVALGSGGFTSREDFIERGAELIKKKLDCAVVLPVHYYEHGNQGISTTMDRYPFNCPWDSGTIGFAVVTKKDIRENWSIKRISKKYVEDATRILEAEVETLNQWMSGDVYGFQLEDEEGEEIDSCWGFYGSDPKENGMVDHISDEEVCEFIKTL